MPASKHRPIMTEHVELYEQYVIRDDDGVRLNEKAMIEKMADMMPSKRGRFSKQIKNYAADQDAISAQKKGLNDLFGVVYGD